MIIIIIMKKWHSFYRNFNFLIKCGKKRKKRFPTIIVVLSAVSFFLLLRLNLLTVL